MGLTDLLARLLAKLPRSVVPAPSNQSVLERLAAQGYWMLAKPKGEGDESKGNVQFFDYFDQKGAHVWPIFSSQDRASEYFRDHIANQKAYSSVGLLECKIV